MSDSAAEVVREYLAGGLAPEAGAARLHALLEAGTDLSLEIRPRLVPLLEALHRRLSPGAPFVLPPAPPVVWDGSPWGGLVSTADDVWQMIEAGGMQQRPVSLDYRFRVGSEAALLAIESWLRAHSEDLVEVERPPSFAHFHGVVHARTPPRILDRAAVVAWVERLRRMPRFPDASPDGLGLSRPA